MARLRRGPHRFPSRDHPHPGMSRPGLERRSGVAALVALVLCCGLLVSCLGAPGAADLSASPDSTTVRTDDRNPAARDELARGGDLRIGVVGPRSQWNPWHRGTLFTTMPRVLDPVTPRFFVTDASGRLVADPDYLAAEPVATGNPLVVTLTLNPRAVWADGHPITWQDVRAPLMACRKPDAQCVDTTGPGRVASVTRGVDDFEAVVTFTGPAADWRHVLRAPGRAELFTDPATFSWDEPDLRAQAGPFVIDSYDPATGLVTEVPNTRWWGDPPVLDRISFRWLEPDALAPAFANNEIDVVPATLDRNATSRVRAVDGTLRKARSRDVRTVLLNSDSGPLADVRVRRALVRAIDREALRRADLAELDVGGAPWPATVLGNRLLRPDDKGYRDNSAELGAAPDTAAAVDLLAEAGWRRGSDGILVKRGVRLRLDYVQVAGAAVARDDALALVAQLRDIGVQVSVVEVPAQELAPRLREGRYDLTTITVPGSISPSQLYGSRGSANVTGSASSAIDAQLAAWCAAADGVEAGTIANRLDVLLWREAATIPLYQVPQSVGVRKSLANIGALGPATVDWTLVGYRV